ncbi:MAG: TM1802 family CRISPR-associated protein [Candidatus Aenigmarchaeota archaeon]|nr:TM1802 family CRISPR-associated protein [Candidatus Aenigmarchaeota archaeon]MDW8149134.1 TM1802 family CRISPR-associated protein [Candidatus Aenigmarchaeota archaeon]
MLKTLALIGKLKGDKDMKDIILHKVLKKGQNKKQETSIQKIVFANVNINSNTISWDENFVIEEFDINKTDKYLYGINDRKDGQLAPVMNIKNEKRLNWIIEACKKKQNIDKGLFKRLANFLTDTSKDLSEKLKNFCQSIEIEKAEDNKKKKKKPENLLFSIKINKQYLGEFEINGIKVFNDYYKERKESTFFEQFAEGVCCICGERKSVSYKCPFPFLTFDKPGYTTGGFSESAKIKNFPLCYDCFQNIEKGKNFILTKPATFGGIKFYIVPKFLISNDYAVIDKIINILSERYEISNLSKQEYSVIAKTEDNIMRKISELDDVFLMDFVFFDNSKTKDNERLKIVLLIEDVYPSRLKTIMQAVDKVLDSNRNNKPLFYIIKDILFATAKGKDSQKIAYREFLKVTDCIIKDKKIDFEWLCSKFNKYIKKNRDYLNFAIEDTNKVYMFFSYLELLQSKGGENV